MNTAGAKPYKKIPAFQNRWLIQGTLTTESLLHIGDGGEAPLWARDQPIDPVQEEIAASTICVDHLGRSYLPGSGLRGALRALVFDELGKPRNTPLKGGGPAPNWLEIFGSVRPDDLDAQGGRLQVWDAFHLRVEGPDPAPAVQGSDGDRCLPYCDPRRRTCVAASVSLDRQTRSAREHLLYHLECVPPGETFTVEIGGDDLEPEAVAGLLALLETFNTRQTSLGALNSCGWGRLTWRRTALRCLDAEGLEAWKENPCPDPEGLPEAPSGLLAEIDKLKGEIALPPGPARLTLDLRIPLETWLVRDPRQKERAAASEGSDGPMPRHAVPLHWVDGNPYLPAKGFRGALRAQAERILRTLDLPCANHPMEPLAVSAKNQPSSPLDALREADLAARLFGFSGWETPLAFQDLLPEGAVAEATQEFLAVDRFTGGGFEGRKFNATVAGRATLKGPLTLDLDRIKKSDPKLASLGLLALVLRDLKEGDMALGSGAAKGHGHCSAEAKVTEDQGGPPVEFDSLDAWFRGSTLLPKALEALRAPKTTPMEPTHG